MRANERMIFVGVALFALAVGFYLLVLSPKRDEAGKLKDQINELNGAITAAQQQASYGEQARKEFPKYYGRMVVLGKAVPAESDTASMLVQLNSITNQSHMDLRAIALNQGEGGTSSTSAPTPPPTSPPTSPTGATERATAAANTESTTNTATPTATPAPATEATAASLPIGSSVGPAGLPTLPYSLAMRGSYFDVANFIGKIDGLVTPVDGGAQLSPDGRLMTINGFSLSLFGSGSSPRLKANFEVTTYSTGDQGLTAGASSSGPSPVTPAPSGTGETQVQPASAVVPK